jgi:hypothetical protein
MPIDTDEAIDEVIATCDGDLRGAVRALLLVNERLETELKSVCERTLHLSPLMPDDFFLSQSFLKH